MGSETSKIPIVNELPGNYVFSHMEPENCIERPLCHNTERWLRMREV
jgi:hypothetical protein